MNDSISSWLSSILGTGNQQPTTMGMVPATPGQAGVDITGTQAGNNLYQTPGLAAQSPSTLQYAGAGINAIQGLASMYLGFQNAGTAKKQAAQAQSNWNKQWDANVKTTNASLADRQAARVASNPNAYASVDSYMQKYGIS